MSAEAAALARIPSADVEWSRRRAQIFRLAFGMTFSAGIALGLAWPLAFISPVLAAKLLTLPKVMPVKAAAAFVVILSGSLILSVLFLLPTLAYPVVHLLLTGLILFLLFYAKAGGANPILVVFLLVGVLVVPLMGTVSETLALAAAKGLIFGTFIAVAMVYVAAAVFPDPPGLDATVATGKPEPGGKGADGEPGPPPPSVRATLALRSLLVLYPVAVVFQLFSLAEYAVVLIMAGLLALEPTFGKHLAAGKGLVFTNLAGGLVAVVIYQLLVWVPAYPFFLLLVLLAGLWVGGWIFSDRPLGKLLGGGITAVFIILGPVVTGDAEAGEALYLRVVMIMGAVLYVVLAFGLLERVTRGRRRAP